jgi:hypothetical protein
MKPRPVDFRPFIGQRVVRVNDRYPDRTFVLTLENGFLHIECPWRIRRQVILIGSAECNQAEGFSYRTVRKHLRKRSIAKIIHSVPTSDLSIEFDDGTTLDLFHNSACYEGWQLIGKEFDFHLISLPGGDFAFFGDAAYVTMDE